LLFGYTVSEWVLKWRLDRRARCPRQHINPRTLWYIFSSEGCV
jgi:hypothetical protein